jgi:hypothetical protein
MLCASTRTGLAPLASPDPTAMREELLACGCLKTQERNPHKASYPFPNSGTVEVSDSGGKLSYSQRGGDRGSAVATCGLIEFTRLRACMIVDVTRSRVAGLG